MDKHSMNFSNRHRRFHLNILLYLAASVVLFGGIALAASAQTNPQSAIPDDYGLTATATGANLPHGDVDPIDIAAGIVNVLLGVLGVILVVLVVYAGFLWMTSAGEEEKIRKAKALLGNAVVGLIIVLASYTIAYYTINSLQKSTGYGASSGSSNSNLVTCASQDGYCNAMGYTYEHSIGPMDCPQTPPPPQSCWVPN